MSNQHKTCTKCGEVKPLDGFHKHRRKKDGLQSRCKACRAEQSRRYHEDNRERKATYNRRYYKENREQVLEGKRRYYEENRDFVKEETKAAYSNCQELSAMLATVPPRTPWTPEEEVYLMADNGLTTYQKAVELGRTYRSSITRRHKLRTKST